MKIAMFGGSFNPIHNGHIQIVQAVKERFGLDKMLIMVAGDPPHKEIADGVSAQVRYDVAKAALEGMDGIEVCDLEIRRGGKSYTVDTMRILKGMYPQDEVYCMVGADMLLSIHTWYNAEALLKENTFIAVGRPDSGDIEAAAEWLKKEYGANIMLAGITGPDVSSTMIRNRVEKGEPIEGLLPESAIRYIYENCLYTDKYIDDVYARLKKTLSKDRLIHTMGVVRSAAQLALWYDVDPIKARIAAILHDCAKVQKETVVQWAEEYGLDTTGIPLPALHGYVGAVKAYREYGVTDEDVLRAIAVHTLCAPSMTKLDKVVYLADKIEYGREFDGVEGIRIAAEYDLDSAVKLSIEHSFDYIVSKGCAIHPNTLAAYKELKTINKRINHSIFKEETHFGNS